MILSNKLGFILEKSIFLYKENLAKTKAKNERQIDKRK